MHKFLSHTSETTFSKQFSVFFVVVAILKFRIHKNMCKLCHKVRNGQNRLPKIKFYKLYFAKAFYRQLMPFFMK